MRQYFSRESKIWPSIIKYSKYVIILFFIIPIFITLYPLQSKADAYNECYKQIESQYGPYTDISWMRKVWACTECKQMPSTCAKESSADNGQNGRKQPFECDFEKRVGSCQAQIQIVGTSGSKGSYSAEIVVRSSAPACSKVDYHLDNTPQRTILRSTNSQEESVFGTKPISQKNFEVTGCAVFADR